MQEVETSMLKRFLVGVSIALTIAGVFYVAAVAILVRQLTIMDPLPSFMASYQLKRTGTYAEAERAFPEFVSETFPVGSNAKQAVALVTSQGFDVVSSPDSSLLRWTRRAGPCAEQYSIMIRQSSDGSIVEAAGQMHPACL
jgi:hypothetical protein